MSLKQAPSQTPVANGAQAEPGGNPLAKQSASRWQSVQAMPLPMVTSAQKTLPAVVWRQRQFALSLQVCSVGFAAVQ